MLAKVCLVLLLVAVATARFTRPRYTTRRYYSTTASPRTPLEALADRNGVRVWKDSGSFGRKDLTVYEATRPSGIWFILGQRAQPNYERLSRPVHAFKTVDSRSNALSRPIGFSFIWDDRGGTTSDGSTWRPICSRGYVAVGDVFIKGNRFSSPPNALFDKVRCVRDDLTETCNGLGSKIWDNAGAWGKYYISVWSTNPRWSGLDGYFYAHNQHNAQPNITPYCLKKSAFREL